MKQYTVAILGATGAVGQEMIRILQERNFPVGKLIPLASERSAGKTIQFQGKDVTIQLACDSAFEGVDIVLGAAENDIAKQFAPAIVKAGAVFVDNSSACIAYFTGEKGGTAYTVHRAVKNLSYIVNIYNNPQQKFDFSVEE